MRREWGVLSVIVFCLAAGNIHAEDELLFPRFLNTARSFSLGNNGAVLSGLDALSGNPAGLFTSHKEFLTHTQTLAFDTRLSFLGVAQPVFQGKYSLSLTYMNLRIGRFQGRDASGLPQGEFSTDDQMIAIHAARALRGHLQAGWGLKRYSFQVGADKAATYSVDLGLRREWPAHGLSAGVSLLDLGKAARLAESASPLPSRLAAGVAYRVLPFLTLEASHEYLLASRRSSWQMGGEIQPARALSLRSRYEMWPGAGTEKNSSNVGFGLGLLIFRETSLDYAFQTSDASFKQAGAQDQHRITVTFRWGGTKS